MSVFNEKVNIQLMDSFVIYVNGIKIDQLVQKSRKGVALVQYLILSGGETVSKQRLMSSLWAEEMNSNPENALKTLVSRMRTLLNQVAPGLGKCIVADRGGYHWQCVEGVTVDVLEIEDLLTTLEGLRADQLHQRRELTQRLMLLYIGDLSENDGGEHSDRVISKGISLHNRYLEAVFEYVKQLKAEENYDEVISVCRMALDIDRFDDHLHIELMNALIKKNRTTEALNQYKHAVNLSYRYLGVQPSKELQDFYTQIVTANRTLAFNLETIRAELLDSGNADGALLCEYAVFKEVYNLQIRNLERLGSSMFLVVMMVSDRQGAALDLLKQDNMVQGLIGVLQHNLRKGDVITQFNMTMVAMLLPNTNYMTCNTVVDRIKRVFYKKFPNSNVMLSYRIGPLGLAGSEQQRKNRELDAGEGDEVTSFDAE